MAYPCTCNQGRIYVPDAMSPLKSDFNELGSVIFLISFVYNNENLPVHL